jgi:hypothetical protein
LLDTFAFGKDRLRSAEVNVGRGNIVDALVVAGVIVVLDEEADLPFEITG